MNARDRHSQHTTMELSCYIVPVCLGGLLLDIVFNGYHKSEIFFRLGKMP